MQMSTDTNTGDTRPTVAVIGGGYAGYSTARELDDFADVTLIEPRDAFVHNVARPAARWSTPATGCRTCFTPLRPPARQQQPSRA